MSIVVPIPLKILKAYRAMIIIRLIIVVIFIIYRLTNPVDDAYALWITSVISEIWFSLSWVLDQFPKWSPINRTTYMDVLSARYKSS